MDTNKLQLDLTINMCAPAVVGVCLSWFRVYDQMSTMSKMSGWLCMVQVFCFFFGLFITRVSEVRSEYYIKIMPELTYCASYMAWFVLPLAILLFNFQGFFLIETVEILAPYMAFTMLVQVGILVSYFVNFKPLYLRDFEIATNERIAYLALQKRG